MGTHCRLMMLLTWSIMNEHVSILRTASRSMPTYWQTEDFSQLKDQMVGNGPL